MSFSVYVATIRPMISGARKLSMADAEQIAVRAVTFIVEDAARLDRFLSLTGWTPETLKDDLARPDFLQAVLEHLCTDETLLLTFASNASIDPALVERARHVHDAGRD